MTEIQQAMKVSKVLKKHFTNLTVSQCLDIAEEIVVELREAKNA